MKKILALALLALPFALFAHIEVQQFDNAQQEADYRTLIAELRCPQCQNNNIADSNATIATDMRHKTLELLKQGKSRAEVVEYMVARYGNFVTYDPPMTIATVFLWIAPALLILLGLIWVGRRKSRTVQAVKNQQHFAKDEARLRKILEESEK